MQYPNFPCYSVSGCGSFFVALAAVFFCYFVTVLTFRRSKSQSRRLSELGNPQPCDCAYAGQKSEIHSEKVMASHLSNGEMEVDKQTVASMMEQLVPEIRTHALSYLDYPSLCRLSMTNSVMRRAANDDNVWKALYHKDFTLEQDNVTPANGWKAYYASTRAIINTNTQFFTIINERSLPAMGQFWLNADYVKCFHANGESFSGYNAVMGSWQLAFTWDNVADFHIRDVRTRVLTDMAWVTMKAYVDMDAGPFLITNVYEYHNGRWFMVHHHSSPFLDGGQQFMQA